MRKGRNFQRMLKKAHPALSGTSEHDRKLPAAEWKKWGGAEIVRGFYTAEGPGRKSRSKSETGMGRASR